MAIEFTTAREVPDDADLLVVPVFAGRTVPSGSAAEVDTRFLEARRFEGRPGEALPLLADDGSTVLAVGLGDSATATADTYRRAAAVAVRQAGASRHVAFALSPGMEVDRAAASQAIAEGARLGAYRYTTYKSEPKRSAVERVTVVDGDADAVATGARVGEAVALARDLVNGPPDEVTPERLAEVAREIAESEDLAVEVWDEERIRRERLGGILGVASGSARPPRLIKLTYEPDGGSDTTVALVGKGITFDSGGLSIKTGEGMMSMKTDMSGAAIVIAAMSAVRAIGPRVRVVAYAACTENLPSGTAMKPGDVLRIRNGKTVEVLNTDAEGRLVLADALSLAVEDGADAIVDLATLTGAVSIALGREIAGLMGNDQGFVDEVRAASERAGEDVWQLPLPDRYRKHIDSDVADIKNIGAPGQAGTIAAGMFLKEFVAGVPWAHLDIAGTGRSDSDDGYITKGGTAFGLRTVLELVRGFDGEIDQTR